MCLRYKKTYCWRCWVSKNDFDLMNWTEQEKDLWEGGNIVYISV